MKHEASKSTSVKWHLKINNLDYISWQFLMRAVLAEHVGSILKPIYLYCNKSKHHRLTAKFIKFKGVKLSMNNIMIFTFK